VRSDSDDANGAESAQHIATFLHNHSELAIRTAIMVLVAQNFSFYEAVQLALDALDPLLIAGGPLLQYAFAMLGETISGWRGGSRAQAGQRAAGLQGGWMPRDTVAGMSAMPPAQQTALIRASHQETGEDVQAARRGVGLPAVLPRGTTAAGRAGRAGRAAAAAAGRAGRAGRAAAGRAWGERGRAGGGPLHAHAARRVCGRGGHRLAQEDDGRVGGVHVPPQVLSYAPSSADTTREGGGDQQVEECAPAPAPEPVPHAGCLVLRRPWRP
jgi:hypothetical protein